MSIHCIHNREQVALWSNFPEFPCDSMREKKQAHVQSIATHVRDQGDMTKASAQLLADVAARWAGVKITLEPGRGQSPEAGAADAHVVLCVRGGAKFNEFDIKSPTGLVRAPPLASQDPVCSTSLLRAIAGGVSLSGLELPRTVYTEQGHEFALPLPVAAKPNALAIAQSIWSNVETVLPHVRLADHTDKDAMGTMNLGSMFKVIGLLMAQGALCKYIIYVIHEFQLVFLSDQNVVYVGSGIGKTAWLFSTLAQLDLKIFAFERYARNHDMSAQTLTYIRKHAKVHNLKVAHSL